jgi:hypothetical protein
MKAAIIILSDPHSGSEEALGRAFNGLAVAYDFREQGSEVNIYFAGTGTRWIKTLSSPDHPVHGLFETVKDSVVGASCGCADVFGATDDIKASPFNLVSENQVPGTSGLPSTHKLLAEGYQVLVF